MRRRDGIINSGQRVIFGELLELIREHAELKEQLSQKFKAFLVRENVDFASRTNISRLIRAEKNPQYERWIYLFDYVNDHFLPYLVKRSKYTIQYATIIDKYDELKASLDPMLVLNDNPLISIYSRMGSHNHEIPLRFYNRFIGYRRSSNMGEVVRFFLETHQSSDRDKLIFSNEYYRNHNHWKVDGIGLYVDQTLYLFGYAKDYETDESFGYRIMALRPLGIGNVLTGPLISMDESGPIAARVVLAPLEDHSLTDGQEELKEKNNGLLESHMINPTSSDNVHKYIDEIKDNMEGVFPGYPDNHIFKLISNFTLSTVKGKPRESDPITKKELEYRKLAHLNGWDLSIIEALIEKALDEGKDLYPRH